jgi:hypothetical protein
MFKPGTIRVLTLVALMCGAGCNGTPSAPTPAPPKPPVADAPEVTCPAPVTVSALKSEGAPVTYALPESQKGQGTVSVACTPPSGTTFPVGVTQAECVATDSLSRTGSCTFFGDRRRAAAPAPNADHGVRRQHYRGATILSNDPYDIVHPTCNSVSNGAGAIAVGTLHRSNHHCSTEAGSASRRLGAAAFYRHLRGRLAGRGRVDGGLQRRQSGRQRRRRYRERHSRDHRTGRRGRRRGARVFICTLAPGRPGRGQIQTSALEFINDRLRQVARNEARCWSTCSAPWCRT